MKLQCAKRDLAFGVQTVQKAVASRIAIPALGGILLSADKTSQILTLRATDLELTISCKIESSIEEEGSIVVPGRFLAEISRNLSADNVEIESSGSNVALRCGAGKYNLRTLPAEEFPEKNGVEGHIVSLDKSSLIKGIKKVARAAARDESRPTISGVLISLNTDKLEVVATDSYRLALYSTTLKHDGDQPQGAADGVTLILPTRSLEEVVRIFGADETGPFKVVVGDGEVSFSSDNIQIITRTIEGSFPQYRQILPQDFEVSAEIGREDLLGAVRRAAVVANTSPLKFTWQQGGVEVSAGTQEVGEAQEVIDANFGREDSFEIAFNPLFLQDGLQTIEGEKVEFKFNSPVKPGLITSQSDEGYIYLIMPVRT